MNTVALAWRYLWARPLAAALNLLLLALGLGAICFVLLVGEQLQRQFTRNLAGIDAVVGAKGSPMQLILAGVFQIDVPPGNIPLQAVQELAANPQVARVVPISMGDSFQGFRIVGTTPDYLALYGLRLAHGAAQEQTQGQAALAPMQALAGAEVARRTGLKAGDSFVGTHGLAAGGHAHGDTPYRVAGVLAPCGCVADRLLLTALESVWQVHENYLATDEEDRKALAAEREVTMVLVTYRTPLAAVSFPRLVNTTTALQAAAPAVEITRLARMIGVGTELLQGIGAVLLLVAGLSVFIALWSAVRERRADIAMLRMLGAGPGRVAALVLCEALWLAALGCLLGLAAGHGLAQLVGWVLAGQQSVPVSGAVLVAQEAWIPVVATGVALLAALVPAAGAYRFPVARLLQSR